MTLPRPRALAFDLDGTLVDSVDDLATAANFVRRDRGLAELPVATVRGFIGDGARMLLQRTLQDVDPPPDLDAAFRTFRSHYAEHCLDRTVPYPGVMDTLAAWSSLPMAVVTNKPHDMAERILRGLGLDRYCRTLVGARPGVPVKPAPDLLLEALAAMGTPPGEAWMVGDSLNDVGAGRAAGCTVVAVSYGLGDADALREAGADAVIDTFDQLRTL